MELEKYLESAHLHQAADCFRLYFFPIPDHSVQSFTGIWIKLRYVIDIL